MWLPSRFFSVCMNENIKSFVCFIHYSTMMPCIAVAAIVNKEHLNVILIKSITAVLYGVSMYIRAKLHVTLNIVAEVCLKLANFSVTKSSCSAFLFQTQSTFSICAVFPQKCPLLSCHLALK